MFPLYHLDQHFKTRRSAENFARHVTRELTAGGVPHWVEVRQDAAGLWHARVHRPDCSAERCVCGPAR